MKKKLFSLALSLALCLGLALPALAVDTSGLDANGAKAFYDVLSGYGKNKVIEFADVKDMNADGVPELIAVVFDTDATVEIWQLKDGKAVKVTNEPCFSGIEGSMGYYTQNGKTYIRTYADKWASGGGIAISEDSLITIGGVYEALEFYGEYDENGEILAEEYSHTIGGKTTGITKTQYDQIASAFPQSDNDFLEWSGWLGSDWRGVYDGKHGPSYQTVLNQLYAKSKATPAPAPGTFGPYTITGGKYDFTITFDSVMVEEKIVQIRENNFTDFDLERDPTKAEHGPYQSVKVKILTLKPNTMVYARDVENNLDFVQLLEYGVDDGGGKYSMEPVSLSFIATGRATEAFLDMGRADFARIYGEHTSDGTDYLLRIQDTVPGFSDVKNGAYYADAVKWAVDRNITNGTGGGKFSPDETCNKAQILTFLWRANGSPEPTGRNPFSDISASDYYYKAALWAYGKGLVSGSKFSPNTPCTRAMTVEYLWKLAGSPSVKSESYKPLTISNDGYIMLFDAAIMAKTTITTVEYFGEETREPATMIIVRPDTKITFKGAYEDIEGWDDIYEPAESVGGYRPENGKFMAGDPRGGLPVCSGIIKDVWPRNVYNDTWVLKLIIQKARDGSPYYLVLDTNTEALAAASVSAAISFADVPTSANYAQAVAWAVQQGITNGTGNGKFSPGETCSRGQIATFLYRAMA